MKSTAMPGVPEPVAREIGREMEREIELRVLGPVEVGARGRTIRIRSRRSRIMLAMLGVEAGRPVAVDRITEAIWDDDPPSTARGQIQICVSELRRMFEGIGYRHVLVTRPPGYALEVPVGAIDLQRFEDLAGRAWSLSEQGDLVSAAHCLDEASALWRGDALAGLDGRLVSAVRTRLDEKRLAAIEDRIRLNMVLGRHESLVRELTDLVARYPLRERLQAHLMLALYRSGRQAEALERYQRARQVFIDELGIEPGEELRGLQHAILVQDTSLCEPRGVPGWTPRPSAPARAVPRLLLPDVADFTGRHALLDDMRARLRNAASTPGAPPVLVVSGPGGVGKTTTAMRLAHDLAPDYPDGQLYVNLQGCSADPECPTHVLSRFLGALGARERSLSTGVERAEAYRSRLADRRMLIVLDDAADEEQIAPLIPVGAGNAVIVTSRARLGGLPGAEHVDVPTLDTDTAIQMLGRVIGPERVSAEPESAAALARLCGHLPLALRIAAARLASRPHWRLLDLVGRLRSETRILDELVYGELRVRSSIEASCASLDLPARRLLRRLSVLPAPDIGSWVAAPLLDAAPDDAAEVLNQLVDVHLVEATTTAGDGIRYRLHDLVRVYARERFLAEEAPGCRDTVMRRLLGAWLELVGEAHRREYGGDHGVLHGAAVRWALPAQHTDLLLADPTAWWTAERSAMVAVIRLAASAGFHEVCWDLALTSATFFERHTRFDDWWETGTLALQAARAAGDRRGEAAMLYSLGTLDLTLYSLAGARAQLDSALELFRAEGDQRGQALALRNLAVLHRLNGESGEAAAAYERTLTLFRTVGDDVACADVLSGMAQLKLDASDTQAAGMLLAEAKETSDALGCRHVQARVLRRLGDYYLRTDKAEQAEDVFYQVLRITREIADHTGEANALLGLGDARLRQGRLAGTEKALAQARQISQHIGERIVEGRAALTLAELEHVRGKVPQAIPLVESAEEIFARMGVRLWQSRATLALGRLRGQRPRQTDPPPDRVLDRLPVEDPAIRTHPHHDESGLRLVMRPSA
ncbi:BTAD domain-containing putative transcriptional regulator [Spongiactinospora sp. TRM90649]|uniref:AfsR/SARP family transcriptional regulator n=1 Tax=Spongiactinospora sp. TRM90649 TaxID=3031114 RepID=UPI0023F97154|nr:BTAD domain-containing putative transcriptional regulator [Spongiactinospora sp. TRM90649]MDF5753258.1 BTAD domain-containing putative transcriptional regulator [Spongiactinospora sp. TRM90649]